MNYQVCWTDDNFPLWTAKFFETKESALEHYNLMKSVFTQVRILTIGGKDARN